MLNHRLLLNYKARFDRVKSLQLIEQLLDQCNEADLDLPEGIELKDTQQT